MGVVNTIGTLDIHVIGEQTNILFALIIHVMGCQTETAWTFLPFLSSANEQIISISTSLVIKNVFPKQNVMYCKAALHTCILVYPLDCISGVCSDCIFTYVLDFMWCLFTEGFTSKEKTQKCRNDRNSSYKIYMYLGVPSNPQRVKFTPNYQYSTYEFQNNFGLHTRAPIYVHWQTWHPSVKLH